MTQDLLIQQGYLRPLAADTNAGLLADYHIRTGQDLTYIVAHPTDFSAVQPSEWDTAIPATARNAFTFEPYPSDTVASETSAANTLVTSAQSSTSVGPRYYVYEAWPPTTQWTSPATYDSYWNAGITVVDSTPFTLQLAAENAIYTRLQATLGRNVYVIPIGDVLDQVDVQARAGSIPGVSKVDDLYRDVNHMSAPGHYLAAITYLDTILGKQVRGSAATIALFANVNPGTVTLTQSLATQFENIAWTVVSADPRAIH